MQSSPIPVVLFAFARPLHLAKVLDCLRRDSVPLLYAFSDGARHEHDDLLVEETRELLRGVDWCDLRLECRSENLGLGRNVLSGVTEVASHHDAFIVVEDDLISVRGTYEWVCSALRYYGPDSRVMSVSAWNHPRVTPRDVAANPYLDGRAECWYWGSWSSSWKGMEAENAVSKMKAAAGRGVAPGAYGADLPEQARYEERRNVWAVRWLYHHFRYDGLCVRPPWSMVEHIGFDSSGTNVQPSETDAWSNPPLRSAPPEPQQWPKAIEHPDCRALWCSANPGGWRRWLQRAKQRVSRL